MGRRPSRFTEAEIRRLTKAARADGVSITMDPDTGRITIAPGSSLPSDEDPTNLDRTFMDRMRNRPWAQQK